MKAKHITLSNAPHDIIPLCNLWKWMQSMDLLYYKMPHTCIVRFLRIIQVHLNWNVSPSWDHIVSTSLFCYHHLCAFQWPLISKLLTWQWKPCLRTLWLGTGARCLGTNPNTHWEGVLDIWAMMHSPQKISMPITLIEESSTNSLEPSSV